MYCRMPLLMQYGLWEENNLERCGFGSFRGGKGGAGSGKISLSLENEHTDRLRDCFIHERAINWGSVYKSALWERVRYPVGHVHDIFYFEVNQCVS